MRRRQLLEGDLGSCPQLGHDLAGAERAQLPTALQRLALGEAMQEPSGIEVSCSCGVDQVSKAEDAEIPALISTKHDRSLGSAGDRYH